MKPSPPLPNPSPNREGFDPKATNRSQTFPCVGEGFEKDFKGRLTNKYRNNLSLSTNTSPVPPLMPAMTKLPTASPRTGLGKDSREGLS
ncbi:hypothetical protein FHS27_000745 [Rhodopirellula rubra]|uniref:Uncharacterized protein n=1 Tax=Aporhodopirellula rubra TaxID=980271 RepID=A0A7W5DUV5_9BACT|nr:hypothetical protein [Aporhodopirellula rubra]